MRKHARPSRTLVLALAILMLAPRPAAVAQSRADSPLDLGAAGLGQAINRLAVSAGVLHTGAHPDDEDSGLLAYLARGRQARTAYLSLTRGDGGQNLIGPELYETLGVIRTEELLAARRLDGASQFFTRAFDFGFSKSRDEALAKWDKEAVLRDMVRVIRTFRPQVIVSQWTGTPRDGHGHHQAAGFLTVEAYHAAADPAAYPDQIAEGLRPWKAKKLYRRAIAPRQQNEPAEPPTLTVDTGQYDPLLGRSYYEIAMWGRSQHRSQDQGALEARGPHLSRLKLVDSSVGSPKQEKDIFEGIDPTVTGIAQAAGQKGGRLRQGLAEVQRLAVEARGRYNAFSPSELSPILARGLEKIREIRRGLSALGLSESEMYETDFLLARKESDFADALIKSEGVVLDCLTDDEIITPGQTFTVTVTAYAASSAAVAGVKLSAAEGWAAEQQKQTSSTASGRLISQTDFKVTAGRDADLTSPYWLKGARRGDMFVPGKGGTGIEPQAAPSLAATVELIVGGQRVSVSRPAQYRYADKALGEIRRELKVAPALSVTVTPPIIIAPISGGPQKHEIGVSLINNLKQGRRGTLSLQLPEGWSAAPAEIAFDLKREGERQVFAFNVAAPPLGVEQSVEIAAVADIDGTPYRQGQQLASYPHIESRFIIKPARAVARVFDVKVAQGLKVGYIEGAGDDFANALRRLGVEVKVIGAGELAAGDLSVYDVIVTGVRVYEVRPDVIANNTRLLEYVRNGGTLIVQYNKNELAAGNFGPYPFEMNRSPDRVTDERARVSILDQAHPLFNSPNKITDRDFESWVQERGAYFMSKWDARYKPLLASQDPGEELKQGGQLIAEYGRGLYVYTAYAWFRQLPEGVPGAYRLLANLVSLPKSRSTHPSPGR